MDIGLEMPYTLYNSKHFSWEVKTMKTVRAILGGDSQIFLTPDEYPLPKGDIIIRKIRDTFLLTPTRIQPIFSRENEPDNYDDRPYLCGVTPKIL